MTPTERQRVVESLPSELEISHTSPPEGDFHLEAEKQHFYHDLVELLEPAELIARLGERVGDIEKRIRSSGLSPDHLHPEQGHVLQVQGLIEQALPR